MVIDVKIEKTVHEVITDDHDENLFPSATKGLFVEMAKAGFSNPIIDQFVTKDDIAEK